MTAEDGGASLERLLRDTLGSSGAAPRPGPAAGASVDEVLRAGRVRRRRRQFVGSAMAALAVVAAVGATWRVATTPDRERVGVADPRPTDAPTTTGHAAGTSGPAVTSATSVLAGGGSVLTTVSSPPSGPIDAVVVRGATMELRSGSTVVDRFDPCAGVAAPCDVPVVAADGVTVAYLRRAGSHRDVVVRGGGVDTVVTIGTDARTVIDLALGAQLAGGRVLYIVAATDPSAGSGDLIQHTPSEVGLPEDRVLASGVREVVATGDGRVAWVTDRTLVARSADGQRTIPIAPGSGRPSQLSFAPSGPLLLARDGGAASRRVVVDTSAATDLSEARVVAPADAACWQSGSTVVVYDRAAGALRQVDIASGAATDLAMPTFVTEQIACQVSGSVVLVDRSGQQGSGDLLSRTPPGDVSREPGQYDRVRSVR